MLLVSLTIAQKRAPRVEADRLQRSGSPADHETLAIWPQQDFNLLSKPNQPSIYGVLVQTPRSDTKMNSNLQRFRTGRVASVENSL